MNIIELKYYIYVSNDKINWLYDQIPRGILSKIALELKINLSLIEANFREKQTEQTAYDKLKLVVKHLEKSQDVGNIDEPKEYFKGILPMRWGPFGGQESNMVYFGGRTERTSLGLGGSFYNIIGEKRGESSVHSLSGAPVILSILRKELDLPLQHMTQWDEKMVSDKSRDEQLALRSVYLATDQMEGPEQQLEFLAKKLFDGSSELYDRSIRKERTYHVLLGSPLYVSMAE